MPGQLGHRADRVFGGADAGIAWKLSYILNHGPPQHPPYTHIMLLENDVLLDEDWYEPTINLFREGLRDGLDVGAVSPRSMWIGFLYSVMVMQSCIILALVLLSSLEKPPRSCSELSGPTGGRTTSSYSPSFGH